jgi:neutral ceramidase
LLRIAASHDQSPHHLSHTSLLSPIVPSFALLQLLSPSPLFSLYSGNLFDANINRSPTSYLLNPASERHKYSSLGDTDKEMLLIKFTTSSKEDLGMLNWFSVHGTSMNNTNTLISGDNKGYASYLTEKAFNGEGTFVACS